MKQMTDEQIAAMKERTRASIEGTLATLAQVASAAG
jgi:hypothetical protein